VLHAAAAFLDAVDQPGEEFASEEALRLHDGQEILGHSYSSPSREDSTGGADGSTGGS
jgi:hypothetical protein